MYDPTNETTEPPMHDRMPVVPNGPQAASDAIPSAIEPARMRGERLERLRAMMRGQSLGALVLFDPYNQRYATGSRNMFGYFLRNSTRYIFVPLEGPVILFEYPGSAHVSTALETIDHARTSKVVWSSVNSRDTRSAAPFASEIADLVREYGGGSRRVGMDRCFHLLALALEDAGLEAEDCNQHILHARRIKTRDEVACLALSMASSEAAVAEVESAIKPGCTETDLFARMYHSVIAGGGEFIETRLLSSGPRTNPWFNEASSRVVRPGDLVALDTDTIGCNGYYSDFSRTFFCGPGGPTPEQKNLYRMAYEQVQHNISILRPGMSYREVAENAWSIPARYYDARYPSVIHGVGMHGETPMVAHKGDFDTYSGDGTLEPGMVVSVESYIGKPGGAEGVKLEDEVLITDSGAEMLSRYPYDEALLDREH